MKCFIHSCTTDFHKTGISKHRFPKNTHKRNTWLQLIANAENRLFVIETINFETIRLCSKHFSDQSFYTANNQKRLKKDAVPSIFGACPETGLESGYRIMQQIVCDHEAGEGASHSTSLEQSKRDAVVRNLRQRCTRQEQDLIKIKFRLRKLQLANRRFRTQNARLRTRLCKTEQLLTVLQKRKLLLESDKNKLQIFSSNNALLHEIKFRKKGQPFSETLRKFAVTLHFYSPRAYTYVRQVFNNLPSTRTIIRWYIHVNGDPGITQESLDILKEKAKQSNASGKPLLACLLMDEMAIRQQVSWNAHTRKLEGTAQSMPACEDPASVSTVAAKEALVFMLTGITEDFKLPIGYFFIDKMNAEQKKELIRTILINLHEAGVMVIAFTFDGTRTNIATANLLGCNLATNSEPLQTGFQHPCANYNVFVILDVVHMAKLIRNSLYSLKKLVTPHGIVSWNHLEHLNDFQKSTGIRLAKKFNDKHIQFQNSKMKVVLALQLLSNSVATAFDFLVHSRDDFADCKATAEFIHMFNDVFDIFNSMNENAKHFKKPLSGANFDLYYEAFQYVEYFIRNIKLLDGTPVLDSRNKTGFLGFLVAIESFRNIYQIYCEEKKLIETIKTYRFSQDHLEMFFGKMRSKAGSNNNPNTTQFKAIYKRLIKNNDVSCSSYGNCSLSLNTITSPDISGQQEEKQIDMSGFHGHLVDSLDPMMKDAIEVQEKLLSEIKCEDCIKLIMQDSMVSVKCIILATDKKFKELVGEKRNLNIEKYFDYLVESTLEHVLNFKTIFELHMDHGAPTVHHKSDLIMRIIAIYLNLCFNWYAKQIIGFKPSNRQKLTKLILFTGN